MRLVTQKTGKKLPEKRLHTVIPTTDKTTTTTTNTTQRTKSEPFTPPPQTDTKACSRSDFSVVSELPYPTVWDGTQRNKAAQVLDGLSPQQAHDCLVLLAQSITKGKVTNSMGYLHTLAKAARANMLDRSSLASQSFNAPRDVLSASDNHPIPGP